MENIQKIQNETVKNLRRIFKNYQIFEILDMSDLETGWSLKELQFEKENKRQIEELKSDNREFYAGCQPRAVKKELGRFQV